MSSFQSSRKDELQYQTDALLVTPDTELQEETVATALRPFNSLRGYLPAFFYALLTVVNLAIWSTTWTGTRSLSVDAPFPYADVPIVRVTKRLDPGGIHGVPGVIRTPYEGPLTNATREAWDDISEHSEFLSSDVRFFTCSHQTQNPQGPFD